MTFRVVVTGSREYSDLAGRHKVWQVLDDLLAEHGQLVVVHGACRGGADRLAEGWYWQRTVAGARVEVVRFPADWDRYGQRAAGPIRNREMINAGADLIVAFFADPKRRDPSTVNKGTRGCVELAEAAGIPVRRYGWTPEDAGGAAEVSAMADTQDEQGTLL